MNNVLEEFKNAVQAGDEQRIVGAADDVLDTINRRSNLERSSELLAKKIIMNTSDSPEIKSNARNVLAQIKTVETIRSTISQHIMGIAIGALNTDEILTAVDKLQKEKSNLDELTQSLRDTDSVKNIRPILIGISNNQIIEHPRGTSINETITVQNAGGQPTDEIDVAFETDLDPRAEPATISPIPPGESTRLLIKGLENNDSGEYDLRVLLRSQPAQDIVGLRVHILSKVDYLQETISELNQFESRVEDILADTRRSIRPFRNIIDSIVDDIQKIISKINNDELSAQKANQQIEAVSQRLKPLYALIDSTKVLSGLLKSSLKTELDSVEQLLSSAQNASIEN